MMNLWVKTMGLLKESATLPVNPNTAASLVLCRQVKK